MYCGYSFFFFKQKTAYEVRISDWSSDVCSSDLLPHVVVEIGLVTHREPDAVDELFLELRFTQSVPVGVRSSHIYSSSEYVVEPIKIGRASCRERVCQYV